MNRILFEPDEVRPGGLAAFAGARARHIAEVLKAQPGDRLKTGIVDGPIGTGEVLSVAADAAAPDGWRVELQLRDEGESLRPWIDLVLAPPRPRVMKRLLPQLAALGVGHIWLVGAAKVEKDFWGATLLNPGVYRPLLVDGLMQCGTSILPQLEVCRNLRALLARRFGADGGRECRIIAHPYGGAGAIAGAAGRRMVLAVGPEGGWTDAEVAAFEECGFARYSLGARILRTDTALVALISRLEMACDPSVPQQPESAFGFAPPATSP